MSRLFQTILIATILSSRHLMLRGAQAGFFKEIGEDCLLTLATGGTQVGHQTAVSARTATDE